MKADGKKILNWSILPCIAFFALITISLNIQQDKWVVPEAAKRMKNPTNPEDEEGLFIGRSLYMKNCKSCHGKLGKGDGPKAAELKTECGDFTLESFQLSTDGEIFYKTREGYGDMPSFKKLIVNDEDVWFLVNYIRTLK